jgi:hypothetical protein
MLVSNLIQDVMPRVGRLPQSGISLFRAASSVQSLIFKRLLERKSELLATGKLFLVIPIYDYMAPLPSDFLSMAEKPRAVEVPISTEDRTYLADGSYTADSSIYAWGMESAQAWFASTAWLAGTVLSYSVPSKLLIMTATKSNGTGTFSSWHLSVGVAPGEPIYELDTSVSAVSIGLGTKNVTTAEELSLVAGQNVILSNVAFPTDSFTRYQMDPIFLDDDDHVRLWPSNPSAGRPKNYSILGTNFYINPKAVGPVMVTGRYNAKPADFALVTDSIPWNGLFDEVFREGVFWILSKGISMPGTDPLFASFFSREVDTILDSRVRIIPATGRLKRGNYL